MYICIYVYVYYVYVYHPTLCLITMVSKSPLTVVVVERSLMPLRMALFPGSRGGSSGHKKGAHPSESLEVIDEKHSGCMISSW